MELGNPWPVAQRMEGLILPFNPTGIPRNPDLQPLPLRGPWDTWRDCPVGDVRYAPRTLWNPTLIGICVAPWDGEAPNPVPWYTEVFTHLPAWGRWAVVSPLDGPWGALPEWWGEWLALGDQMTQKNGLRLHWVTQNSQVLPHKGSSATWRRGWDAQPPVSSPPPQGKKRTKRGKVS